MVDLAACVCLSVLLHVWMGYVRAHSMEREIEIRKKKGVLIGFKCAREMMLKAEVD